MKRSSKQEAIFAQQEKVEPGLPPPPRLGRTGRTGLPVTRRRKRGQRPRSTSANRLVKRDWTRRGRSAVHGYGLYARRLIPAGTLVIEYVGERITKAEAERREVKRLARLAAGGDGCVYVFELNQRHDIDGRVRWNEARRINHACAPNCEPRNVRGQLWIVALRDIAADEELGYDYGFDFTEWRQHPCRCGAAACAGYIVAEGLRWRIRRALALARKRALVGG